MDRLRDASPAGHEQRLTCSGKQTPFAPGSQASLHASCNYILKRND